MGKTLKFFSKTMRPTACIFGMWQCQVVLYIDPANQAPGVQSGQALGLRSYHKLLMEKTLKNILL